MPQISIIVPVYNAEKYLQQCIDSLRAQTLRDIEIILVNDGSADSSREICEENARIDPRIKIFSKSNEGPAKARRDGIRLSSGDFIAFLDSDDYYEPEFCQQMLSCMLDAGADLAECDYYMVLGDAKREHRIYTSDMVLAAEAFRDTVVRGTIVNGTEAVVLWNKLYKRALIEKTVRQYGENQLEDYLFNAQYYTAVERYAYLHKCLTNYRQLPQSLSRRLDAKTIEVLKAAAAVKQQCMEKMGLNTPADFAEAASWFAAYVQSFLTRLLMSKQDNRKALALQVTQDPDVAEQCARSAEQSRFTRAAAAGQGKAAVRCVQEKVRLLRLKQLGAKCKRMLRRA